MKVSVKTLKGNHFQIDVNPADTVIAVKKQIEDQQGKETFPCSQQLLIHQGKVLKDDTSMADNKVLENSFIVVMLTKSKASAGAAASGSSSNTVQGQPTPSPPLEAPNPSLQAPIHPSEVLAQGATVSVSSSVETPPADATPVQQQGDAYGQAASNLVAGTNLEQAIQQILDIGGGSWDKDTVIRALRAAYNNPERAIEYLYSGIPESTEVPVPVFRHAAPPSPSVGTGAGEVTTGASGGLAAAPSGQNVTSAGPNIAPLDLFPPETAGVGSVAPGALDFLRTNQQFQALRNLVQANPQILQPMLQELAKQNPQLFRLINDNQEEFYRLINEPEDSEGDILGQVAGSMPQTISVTPEEREAIERLEAMGFDRALVLEAFLACDRDEQLAANYLLEHAGDYED